MSSKDVKRLLGEAEDGPYETVVKKVEIYGLGVDAGVEGTATIRWELLMEGRSWGVKDLDVVIKSVNISAMVDSYNSDTPGGKPWSLGWNQQNSEWTTRVEEKGKTQLPRDIYPTAVVVQIQDHTITVEF